MEKNMGKRKKIKKTKAISGEELTVNYQQLSCNCAETDGRMDGWMDGRTRLLVEILVKEIKL